MSTKRHVKEILLLSVFLIASISVISTGVLIQQNQNTTNTEASSYCKCDDNDKCYPDGCSRKPKTSDNKFDEGRYDSVCGDSGLDPGYRMSDGLIQHFCSEQQPSCCFDIYKYKDDRLCCFQERWTCHPSLCKGASGNGDCGKYWGLPSGWDAYGCVKKDSNGDKVPYWGLPPGLPGESNSTPTSTPKPPTSAPPTATKIPTPTKQTQTPQNTAVPTQPQGNNNDGQSNTSGLTRFPVASPTSTAIQPTRSGNSFALDFQDDSNNPNSQDNSQNNQPNDTADQNQPASNSNQDNFEMPQIALKSPKQVLQEAITVERIEQVNKATEKPLSVAKTSFVTIKSYDQKLENTIESWLFKIRVTIQKLLP